MKKLTLFFLSLLALSLGFQACDNSKTYAEMLEEEKDGINDFIKDRNIKVISRSSTGKIPRQSARTGEMLWMSMCSSPAGCTCRLLIRDRKTRLIR
jgi:hypothetical protein